MNENLEKIKDWLEVNKGDGNLVCQNISIKLVIFGNEVEVESLWNEKDTGKVYAHCGCREFEGDLDVDSLSDSNQTRIVSSLK